ncbi:NnrS family protein [Aurantiacibacter spongiae]|nr:NnrS family protein [Aurantiacibacter spongiae]
MTTNTERLELRRRRMAQSPPILRGGFRPFFLGAGAWALIALTIWLAFLFGWDSARLIDDPVAWHRHEMLFGFAGAAIAGFALTAVPNWTGRLPIAGGALAGLFGLWLMGRIVPLTTAGHPVASALLDGGFQILLAFLLGREIVRSGNRNVPVVAIIAAFGIASTLDRLEMGGVVDVGAIGWRGGLALVAVLIALIGGRIVPSFTRNWLASQGCEGRLPAQADRFDLAIMVLGGMALLSWLALPGSLSSGWLLLGAGIGHALRLARWQGWRCASNALVAILHMGYGWLSAGLMLLGLAAFDLVTETLAVHALTTGAIATMILAVMTRATLGHTGRPLMASGITKLSYVLITVAAVARVLAGLAIAPSHALMAVAGAAWCAAFTLFLLEYGPMLWSPRLDEHKVART